MFDDDIARLGSQFPNNLHTRCAADEALGFKDRTEKRVVANQAHVIWPILHIDVCDQGADFAGGI